MSQFPTARRFGAWLVMLAASVPCAAAAGETKPPSDVAAPPLVDGELIYSRDVRHSIGAPHYPGPTHAATTAPTRAMVNAVNIGLAPLDDSENAAITGSLRQFAAPTTQLEMQLAGTGPGASGANALATTQTAAAPGGAIGQAMGALSNALGSLSILTGGRP